MLKVISDVELRRVYEELLVCKGTFIGVPFVVATADGAFALQCANYNDSTLYVDLSLFSELDLASFKSFKQCFESILEDEAGIVRCKGCGEYFWSVDSTKLYSHDDADSFNYCPSCVERGSETHYCCMGCGADAGGCWVCKEDLIFYEHVVKTDIEEQDFGTPTVCKDKLEFVEVHKCKSCGVYHDSYFCCPVCDEEI